MRGTRISLSSKLILTLGAAFALCGQAPDQRAIFGVWENPHGSVRVKTGACGDEICGWVVWASDQAILDARDGGTANLVGTEILRGYRPTGDYSWQGEVFVPDMGGTFFSKIRQVDSEQLKVSGCILHGLFCKSQMWHRS